MINSLYFVDIEATGLDLKNDRLIQLSFLKSKESSIEAYDDLCYTDVEINEAATTVHNITNSMLEEKYWPFETDGFIELEKGNLENNYFISHGNELDLAMLKNEELEIKMKCIDTDKCSRHLLKDAKGYKLESLIIEYDLMSNAQKIAKSIGLENIKAHDALSDALWHHVLFEFLLTKVDGDINSLVAITVKPLLLTKISFGKYRNKTFKEVLEQDPLGLVWMYNNVLIEWADLQYTIAYWLKTKEYLWKKAQRERVC